MTTSIRIKANAGFIVRHYKHRTEGEGDDAKRVERETPFYTVIGKTSDGTVVTIEVEESAGNEAFDGVLADRQLAFGGELAEDYQALRSRLGKLTDDAGAEVDSFLKAVRGRYQIRAQRAKNEKLPTETVAQPPPRPPSPTGARVIEV